MLADASYFVSGQKREISRNDPKDALGDALEYLIRNAFPKMGYIEYVHPSPKPEIQSTLRANDVEQVSLSLDTPEANTRALEDLREYIRLSAVASKQVVLHELINKRYGQRPYGWPELEVVLLVARLAVLKEINLVVNAAPLPLDQAYDHLTSANRQRKVIITQRETAAGDLLKEAQKLGKELFAQQGPDDEESLFGFLLEKLSSWNGALTSYEPLARSGGYPGLTEVEKSLTTLRKFVEEVDSVRFLKRFVENTEELREVAENFHELEGFYTNQKHSWELLRAAVNELTQNRLQLEVHEQAGPALARMEEILGAPRPYGVLSEASALVHTAREVNDQLVSDARKPAVEGIQQLLSSVAEELERASATDELRARATRELKNLRQTASTHTSIAHIAEARQTADDAYDRALRAIEQTQASTSSTSDPPAVKKRRIVDAKALCPGGFIETQQDADAFVDKVRSELKAAIDAGERIQIR